MNTEPQLGRGRDVAIVLTQATTEYTIKKHSANSWQHTTKTLKLLKKKKKKIRCVYNVVIHTPRMVRGCSPALVCVCVCELVHVHKQGTETREQGQQ